MMIAAAIASFITGFIGGTLIILLIPYQKRVKEMEVGLDDRHS